jgi:HD-GYP domain-containing protein (c-di-GMP phosphodiesterase class II)
MLRTVEESSGCADMDRLKKFGNRVNSLGANFAFCNVDGQLMLLCEAGGFKSDAAALMRSSRDAMRKASCGLRSNKEVSVSRSAEGALIFVSVLSSGGEVVGAALIDTDAVGSTAAGKKCLCQLLEIFTESFQAETAADKQIEMVGTELAQVYEELVLLHKLSSNMRISESDTNYLQIACDSLTVIVPVEGIAILLKKNIGGEEQLVMTAGSNAIDMDKQMMTVLYDRLVTEVNSGKDALLDSKVDSPFKYHWPETIRNIVAVPLYGKSKVGGRFTQVAGNGKCVVGLMVAINKVDKPDFDSTDAKLFNCVANYCAVFIENGRLFADLKGLLIGSLRSLTNSIDAKDPYTRGHSERVAFISRWIAERLAESEHLTEEDIHKVYLAGLLHDIGKMGVDESVLRKHGTLSADEFAQMKMHPSIGANILVEIEQMKDIVLGVLQHHERCDGSGYPNHLHSEKISLMGKIIGLADGFDAMTSKRTYREAMSVGQAMAEIEESLGTQFDETVGRAFLNSDVEQLWDIMQDGFKGIYGSSEAADYGTAAVGALINGSISLTTLND